MIPLKKHFHFIPVLVAAAALVMAIWLFTRPKPLDVTVQPVGRGKVEATVINTRAGVVEACQRTKLSTITGGRIDYLGAKEGDRVQAGQVLMRLWQGDLLANQAVAKARLLSAHQRSREACALSKQAEKEAKRQEELVKSRFVSSNAAEKYRAEADARSASCASAGAEAETAERELESIATDIDRTVIVAPFDGTIAKINGEIGEISTPSPTGIAMPPAIDLIDDSCLYVKAPMDEVDAPKIQPGQSVRINVEAIKGEHFTGKVRRIAPYITAVEKQARTVDVDIDFNDPQALSRLLVGNSVDVEIVLDSRDNVLRIPTSSIREGNRVLLLINGTIIERKIMPGVANWEQTEVVSGLSAGDRLITSFTNIKLEPGTRARARASESAKGDGV
ncbi:MAG: efflux RND transporter periplasmic adaptor subunit [Azoarcus sp.]|jgi:HlyD family secretion protein|nr:efflux RND transporter periplasmic adaptor subunit [Azoarcus sp.]